MIRHRLFAYVGFGEDLRYLIDVQATTPANAKGHVKDVIQRCLNRPDEMKLPVSKNAANGMRDIFKQLNELTPESSLGAELAKRVREEASAWYRTISAEFGDRCAYVLTEKMIDVNKLVSDVGSLFTPNVYSALPEMAKLDMKEAGACIAFERPTAAAFHLMRATEMMVRELYLFLVKRDRIKDRMWGPLMADLQKRPKGKRHETLITHLEHIRKNFRNPTQHPDKVYDIYEVQELWNFSVDSINRIAKILRT